MDEEVEGLGHGNQLVFQGLNQVLQLFDRTAQTRHLQVTFFGGFRIFVGFEAVFEVVSDLGQVIDEVRVHECCVATSWSS